MSNLSVTERDGVLVVDSRLIAQDLGIEHRSFVKTIDRYQDKIAGITEKPEDQVLRFEVSKPLHSSKGGRPERFVYMTEAQASFVMTLSRNTPQVVECKRQLVAAFEKAKLALKEIVPAQAQEIERLKLELALTQTQERLMLTSQAIATMHGSGMVALILGKPDAVVEHITEVEKTVLCNERGQPLAIFKGLSKTKLAKRYGMKKPQDFVNWLQSIGKADLLHKGMSATPCQYVPWEEVKELDRLWSQRQGHRQRLLGE